MASIRGRMSCEYEIRARAVARARTRPGRPRGSEREARATAKLRTSSYLSRALARLSKDSQGPNRSEL
jgi:hypothetical protein